MRLKDITIGDFYVNKKNQTMYKVTSMGLHSETLDYTIGYENREGETWYRPVGLFCLKFEKAPL